MKLLLSIFCWIMAAFCIYFPFAYFNSDMNKKEFKLSHILVQSEKQADEIRKDLIDRNITFENAAKKFSLCPSKDRDGYIGYNTRGMLSKELEDAVFKLEEYKVSDPVKSEDGWHLIKVTDIKYFSDSENFGKRY